MEFMLWIWVALTAVAIIVEAATIQMVAVWFACGGLAAIIAYAAHAPYWAQIIVFVAVSALMLLCFRRLALRWLLRNVHTRTNSDSLIGRIVRLTAPVTVDNEGEATIGDVVWSVVAKDGVEISAGTRVEIVGIDGNKLVAVPITAVDAGADPAKD